MENQILATQPNTAVSEVSFFNDFEKMVAMAEYIAKGTLIPDVFKNKPHDVFTALLYAKEMKMNPFMIMQSMYVVYGKAAWSSSFLIACINACGKFSNLEFEFSGEDSKRGLGCRAYATRLSDGKVLEGSWVTMRMAEAEGWTRKNGSKWMTMPEQMLRYRAASFWQRIHAPEVAMGMRDEYEVRDIQDAQFTEVVDEKPVDSKRLEKVKAKAKAQKEAEAQEQKQEAVEPNTVEVKEEVFPDDLPATPEPEPKSAEPQVTPSGYLFANAAEAAAARNK